MATPRKSKTSEEKKPVLYIKTFGWPYVTVARDGLGTVKEDK